VRAVLEQLDGMEALVAGVLYGGGLRLMEALRLRVHDVDFQRRQITVRQGKGGKDRRTMLPATIGEKLRLHREGVRRLHRQDLAEGYGRVQLPHALARSLRKNRLRSSVFPS
jgi:integrase